MPRSPARRTILPRIRRTKMGVSFNMGIQVQDAMTGRPFPKSLCVRQRGHWVNRSYAYGSRDRPADW